MDADDTMLGTNKKAARRRLFNSTLMTADHVAIVAGFDFRRYDMTTMLAKRGSSLSMWMVRGRRTVWVRKLCPLVESS
jgi:hypothetical protein